MSPSDRDLDGNEETHNVPGSGLFFRLGYISEAVVELFTDPELRRKAQTMVYSEAGKQIKGIQEGVASRANTIQKVGEGIPRSFQGLMGRVQNKIQLQRREASLKARRDQPVDVQVGTHLWEDAPQEMRSRLWIALLYNPHLIGNLVEETKLEEEVIKQRNSSSGDQSDDKVADSVSTETSIEGQINDSLPNGTPVVHQSLSGEDTPTSEHEAKERASERKPDVASKIESESISKDSSLHHSDDEEKDERDEDVARRKKLDEEGEVWELVQDASTFIPRNTGSLRESEGSRLLADKLSNSNRKPETLYEKGCRYDTLCQITVGQEEIEEVITRDIDRTFPEHPQFSFEQGQQQLFRVLKAYSLHDLQVGYCQGMAFVTGVILMYVPEEPAFRLLTRLMDERGANLRHLYLPGLEGLKNYLRMLEWLLDRTDPDLKEHLEEHGVSPVLFASQWFLTAFSCPFPASFSCRVIDVMLTENCGNAMLRVAMSVLKACSQDLMQLHDFESLITHLKVEPVSWSQQKSRTVLNEALEGHISDEMLSAASEAILGGYDGSLPRMRSNLKKKDEDQAASTSNNPSNEADDDEPSKLTLPNQISVLEKTSSNSGLMKESEATDAEGKILMAMDALWLPNVDESAEQ